MSPRQVEKGEIPLLPNKVGKKSANDTGPQQGHNNTIEITAHTSCYCVLDLLCVIWFKTFK